MSIKYVLVTGRRSEFENDPARCRLIRTQERDDFKIVSYDSLLEGMRFKRPLYLAVRRNEYYEVSGSEYAGENLFIYLPAHKLKISKNYLTRFMSSGIDGSFSTHQRKITTLKTSFHLSP